MEVMARNPEVAEFFLSRSAHDEVGVAIMEAISFLKDYRILGDLGKYKAPYAVTADWVFCGAAGMAGTYWRLRRKDKTIALSTWALEAPIGPEWVCIELFRPDWPKPDLAHWARKAYDYARAGE
jgi:hypothetical protein